MSEGERRSIWGSGLWAALAAVAMLVWVAWGNRSEDAATGAYSAIAGAESEAERIAAGRLLDEAYAVLRAPSFHQAMTSLSNRYPAVYARNSAQAVSPAEIAGIVDLAPRGSRYAPTKVAIVEVTGSELASAGEAGFTSGRDADMLISRPVLEDFASEDVVRRSCAINVAAHEYAHTISLTPVGLTNAFTDTRSGERGIRNRRAPDTPVASYLIGSVAQCVWLSRQGRIGRADIPACVQVFGVRGFNWSRCRQFAGGEPVALRPGLAPEPSPL
jgi:hypothetical protein